MPKINREALGDCWLAYPSLTEQKDILDWLESETASLDAATERTQQQIELICEYRDRLIADVVTGKQDVRHIAIPTTADGPAIDELEELDEELETDGADVMEEFDGGE